MAAAVLYDKQILLVGGGRKENSTSHLVGFNVESSTWSEVQLLGDIPAVRWGNSATIAGNKLYFFGGWDSSLQYDSLYQLDLENNTWTLLEPSGNHPCVRATHSAVVALGHILIFGGAYCSGGPYVYLNDLVCYDIAKDKWVRPRTTGERPSPRGQHNAVVVGKKMYIIGGINGDSIFNDMYTLDLDTFKWEAVNATGSLPPAHSYEARNFRIHSGHGHAVLHGSCIYMIADNQQLYCFETLSNKWSRFLLEVDKLPPRNLCNIANYKNHAFLLLGTDLGESIKVAELDIDPIFAQPTTPNPFLNDMLTLFNNPTFSDFKFIIKNEDSMEEKTIFAHKNILFARSNYFRGVLTSGMSEAHTNSMVVDYTSYAAFYAYLRYVYCGELVAEDEILLDLLVLANRYGSEHLEELLTSTVGSGIDENNCCELWVFSEQFSFKNLQNMCKDYILRNIEEIYNTNAFLSLSAEKQNEIKAMCNIQQPETNPLKKRK
jgi:hypothetical protein